jgi:hypothetical protein
VSAYLKQNAPGRGRTLLLICVVIEAMITFFAVPDNTRIGLVRQSLLPSRGGCSLCSISGPEREAVSLSSEPPEGVRDDVIRAGLAIIATNASWLFYTKHCSGFASLKGVQISQPGFISNTGGSHQSIIVPYDRAGME